MVILTGFYNAENYIAEAIASVINAASATVVANGPTWSSELAYAHKP